MSNRLLFATIVAVILVTSAIIWVNRRAYKHLNQLEDLQKWVN